MCKEFDGLRDKLFEDAQLQKNYLFISSLVQADLEAGITLLNAASAVILTFYSRLLYQARFTEDDFTKTLAAVTIELEAVLTELIAAVVDTHILCRRRVTNCNRPISQKLTSQKHFAANCRTVAYSQFEFVADQYYILIFNVKYVLRGKHFWLTTTEENKVDLGRLRTIQERICGEGLTYKAYVEDEEDTSNVMGTLQERICGGGLTSYLMEFRFIRPIIVYFYLLIQDSYVSSRATYYGSPDCLGTPTGACGYKTYGSTINGGEVSGVSYKLFMNGTGCGACYQVRCKYAKHCSEEGTKVVVTDHGEGDNTDFILSTRACNKLALPGQAEILFSYGVVDVEYKRISCQYPGYNLMFKVHEHSRFPEYLALIAIYQAGVSEITAVDLWREDCQQWRGMRRAYGAVWDMPNPPEGAINLRFQVSGSKWVQLKSFIPSEWKAGATYDTAIQLD